MDCTPLAHPIILIHGWTDSPTATGTFKAIEKQLTAAGVHFFVPEVSPLGSIEERTQLLIKDMARVYSKGHPVHLIGHSMGGIVARAIAGRTDLPFTVLTDAFREARIAGFDTLTSYPPWMGTVEAHTIRGIFGTDFGGLCNLSTKYMKEFNEKTPNNPKVNYFTWAGQIVLPTLSYAPHWVIVGRFYTKSDGIVGVETASWGEDLGPGTHLGTVPGLTHSSIVCNEVFVRTLPHLRATEIGSTAPVEKISGSLKVQFARRVVGHTDAFQNRFSAWKDRKKHGSDDGGKSGYAFDASEGYKYSTTPTGAIDYHCKC